uniref:RRP15-like protein n=1 Tax=Parascaris equorum TaxID=6256 RepID=A0A914R7S4_PAREQ
MNEEAVKEATFVKEVRDALKHARDRQKKSGKEVTGRSATQVKRDKRKLQIHGGLLRNTFDKNVRRSKHTTVEETQATQRSEDSSGWQNKKLAFTVDTSDQLLNINGAIYIHFILVYFYF